MKRILLATYWYLPHVGGVDAYVRLLAGALRAQGHQVDVLAHHPDMDRFYLTNTGGYLSKWPIKDPIWIYVDHFFQRTRPRVHAWIRSREIERYTMEVAAARLDLGRYDLIHTQDIISTRALARVRPPGVPLVATIHGILATEHLVRGDIADKRSLAWAYVKAEETLAARSADRMIVPCAWLQQRYRKEFDVASRSLTVIPYGLDIDGFLQRMARPPSRPLPPLPAAPEDGAEQGPLLVCPARLVRVKGHRHLLDALALLRQRGERFRCWLVGDGPERAALERQLLRLGLEQHVWLAGNRDDVPSLLRYADLVVLPSLQDTLPFTIMEAQVAGVPVVASAVGGIPEMIVDGETGVLAPPADPRRLAGTLRRLLRAPERRRRIGDQARAWGRRHWHPARLVAQTWAVYEKVLR